MESMVVTIDGIAALAMLTGLILMIVKSIFKRNFLNWDIYLLMGGFVVVIASAMLFPSDAVRGELNPADYIFGAGVILLILSLMILFANKKFIKYIKFILIPIFIFFAGYIASVYSDVIETGLEIEFIKSVILGVIYTIIFFVLIYLSIKNRLEILIPQKIQLPIALGLLFLMHYLDPLPAIAISVFLCLSFLCFVIKALAVRYQSKK